jgi:hypothetical protein
MKLTLKTLTRGALLLGITACTVSAQALTLEEVLRNPSVQALLNRQAEILPAVNLCKDTRYSTQNVERCNVARQAMLVNTLPLEMKAIAQNPRSAQALRSLCLSANSQEKATNYLCTELARTDAAFGQQLSTKSIEDQERERVEAQRIQMRDAP